MSSIINNDINTKSSNQDNDNNNDNDHVIKSTNQEIEEETVVTTRDKSTNQEVDAASIIATKDGLVEIGKQMMLEKMDKENEEIEYKIHKDNIQKFMSESNSNFLKKYGVIYPNIGTSYRQQYKNEVNKIDQNIKNCENEIVKQQMLENAFENTDWKNEVKRLRQKITNLKNEKTIILTNNTQNNQNFYNVLDSFRFIFKHTDSRISILEKENKMLEIDLQEKREDIDETTEELDNIEKEKNTEIDKLTTRVQNLREKCMARNNTIKYLEYTIVAQLFFILTISIFGIQSHYNIVFYGIINPVYVLSNAFLEIILILFAYMWYYIKYIIYMFSNYIVNNTTEFYIDNDIEL